MKKLLLVLVSLIACAFATGAPSHVVAQGSSFATSSVTVETVQVISHEWKSKGVKVVVTTARNAGESATDWMWRHKVAVDAALAINKPDQQAWWGPQFLGPVNGDTLAFMWTDGNGCRVTVWTTKAFWQSNASWLAAHKSACAAGVFYFP